MVNSSEAIIVISTKDIIRDENFISDKTKYALKWFVNLRRMLMKAANVGFTKAYVLIPCFEIKLEDLINFKDIDKKISVYFLSNNLHRSLNSNYLQLKNLTICNASQTNFILKELIKTPFVLLHVNTPVNADDLHLAYNFTLNQMPFIDYYCLVARKTKYRQKSNVISNCNYIVYNDYESNIQILRRNDDKYVDLMNAEDGTMTKCYLDELLLWCFTPSVFDFFIKHTINVDSFTNETNIVNSINHYLNKELITCKLLLN